MRGGGHESNTRNIGYIYDHGSGSSKDVINPSLRYANPPPYFKHGFDPSVVDGGQYSKNMRRYKELQGLLLQAQYAEIVASQELIEAKQNAEPNLTSRKQLLELEHTKVVNLQTQIDALELAIKCDERDERETAIARAIRDGLLKNEDRNLVEEYQQPPPSYYVSQLTGNSYTTLAEYCSAKRLHTADREYWRQIEQILQIEDQIDDALDQVLELFDEQDEFQKQINYEPIVFTPDFVVFASRQLELIEKELLSSIISKQVQETIKRFAQDIIATTVDSLLEISSDEVLAEAIHKIQAIVNQRFQYKVSTQINECIAKHLIKFNEDLQNGKGKQLLKDKVAAYSNVMLQDLAATYVSAVFTSIENIAIGSEQLNSELLAKLAEQVAVTKKQLDDPIDNLDQLAQQLKDHVFKLEQERHVEQLNFSHYLAAQLLNDQALGSLAREPASNIPLQNLLSDQVVDSQIDSFESIDELDEGN